MADTQQRNDEAVSACLGQDTVSRIDQNDGQVRSAGACCHVACVLLVAWRIGNDEFAFRGTEVPIGDINGDALLTLSLQAVCKQRGVEFSAGGTDQF